MNQEELQSAVVAGESETIEFKASTGQRTEAMKTLCAMANSRGGMVLFGVAPDGALRGQQVAAGTLEDIAHELQRFEPPVAADIDTVTLAESNAKVLAVHVPGVGGPYSYDGRAYQRTAATTKVMPRDSYERLLAERRHSAYRWEVQPAVGLGHGDLDTGELVRTVEEGIRRGRLDDPGTRDPRDLLVGLQLVREGRVLNAAVALFGKADRLSINYPQCILRMARFRGVDKTEFIDNRQVNGNAFGLLVQAQRFLRDHLPVAGRVIPGLFEREDDPMYPVEALREALANAFCHRDYSTAGGSVSLAVYDDRLEIGSTGPLPFSQRVEDLWQPHASRPWNPLIARTFFLRGVIESWGRGTLKMAELNQRAGLAPPEIEAERDEVIVRFRPARGLQAVVKGAALSPLQEELLQLLGSQKPMPITDITAALAGNEAPRTIRENLAKLREAGLVKQTGRGKSTRWTR